ncbi:MAG: aminotransferase class III-fold pyridoxal phosphate-dependent enzyme [Deltaproteobacteria bacterium]|nr:aminotransferase class III-fold pyridoxal phosphate-dependent enzyme [Deltaproteobacteria bacterium]
MPYFFTWSAQRGTTGIELSGGEGVYFDTVDKGRFLDMGSLTYQAALGHGHARMIEAVRAQASRLCISTPNAVYPEKEALARELLAHAPAGFDKVFFTLGGSDANENALKMARLFTGRHKVVSRYRSYHGATLGAVSVGGDWRRPLVEPGLPGVVHVLDLDERSGRAGKTDIPRVLELEGRVGAVMLEPVVGHNGVLIPEPDYYARVREACDAHGALLIADEVLVGFGRTGRFFGLEHWKDASGERLVPDMITCGKAITAGYGTLGAVLVHERVSAHFEDHVLAAGLTHYAHPLGVAAALEALRIYDEEKLPERAASMAPQLASALELIVDAQPRVTSYRAIGLFGGVDLELDRPGFTRLAEALERRRVYAHLNAGNGTLIVSPPLIISEDELADGMNRVAEAIDEVCG